MLVPATTAGLELIFLLSTTLLLWGGSKGKVVTKPPSGHQSKSIRFKETLMKTFTKTQLGHPPPFTPSQAPPNQNQCHILHGISPASSRPLLPPLPVASRVPTQAAVKEASKYSLKQQEKINNEERQQFAVTRNTPGRGKGRMGAAP